MGRTQTHSSPDVLSQLLESDDEDDAWLDKPTFLSQQSIPPTNSSSNDATVEEKDDGSSSSASSCSQEEKGEEQSTSQLESSSELPLIAKGAESDKDLAALLERGAWKYSPLPTRSYKAHATSDAPTHNPPPPPPLPELLRLQRTNRPRRRSTIAWI